MRERDTLFKRYCDETNPTLKTAKHNKYKNAQNLVIYIVKKSKENIIRIILKSIQKCLKKPWVSVKSIATLKSNNKTAINSLIVN